MLSNPTRNEINDFELIQEEQIKKQRAIILRARKQMYKVNSEYRKLLAETFQEYDLPASNKKRQVSKIHMIKIDLDAMYDSLETDSINNNYFMRDLIAKYKVVI